jgi:ribosomal protein L16 Arg81 hydroxylase
MLTFGTLTSPVAPDEFLARYWTQRAVLLHDAQRSLASVFDWAALNALLNSGDLVYPSTVVSRNEAVIPAEEFTRGADAKTIDVLAVMRLFRDGASFSIRGAHSHWPALRALIACLSDTFFESVHTNVYCSPARTQGFRCHYDLHEVFVLQVEGTKHWRVFEPTTDFPVEPWRQEDAPGQSDRPYIDATVRKGDVLYVPRGHWHYASAQDTDSLHITVGITCRKGDSLLDWLRPQLLAHPAWRRNVPAMGGPAADGSLPLTNEVVRWSNDLRTVLLEKLADPLLLERFIADVYVDTAAVPTVEMPLDGTPGPLPVEDVVFRRPAGQRHVLTRVGPSRLMLKVARTDIELEDVPEALIAGILASDAFTLADALHWAPETTREEVAELLDHLVRSALLVAEARGSAHERPQASLVR